MIASNIQEKLSCLNLCLSFIKGVFFPHCTSIKAQKLVPAKASLDMPTQVHYMFVPCSRIRQAKDNANPNPHILQFLGRKAMFFLEPILTFFNLRF